MTSSHIDHRSLISTNIEPSSIESIRYRIVMKIVIETFSLDSGDQYLPDYLLCVCYRHVASVTLATVEILNHCTTDNVREEEKKSLVETNQNRTRLQSFRTWTCAGVSKCSRWKRFRSRPELLMCEPVSRDLMLLLVQVELSPLRCVAFRCCWCKDEVVTWHRQKKKWSKPSFFTAPVYLYIYLSCQSIPITNNQTFLCYNNGQICCSIQKCLLVWVWFKQCVGSKVSVTEHVIIRVALIWISIDNIDGSD